MRLRLGFRLLRLSSNLLTQGFKRGSPGFCSGGASIWGFAFLWAALFSLLSATSVAWPTEALSSSEVSAFVPRWNACESFSPAQAVRPSVSRLNKGQLLPSLARSLSEVGYGALKLHLVVLPSVVASSQMQIEHPVIVALNDASAERFLELRQSLAWTQMGDAMFCDPSWVQFERVSLCKRRPIFPQKIKDARSTGTVELSDPFLGVTDAAGCLVRGAPYWNDSGYEVWVAQLGEFSNPSKATAALIWLKDHLIESWIPRNFESVGQLHDVLLSQSRKSVVVHFLVKKNGTFPDPHLSDLKELIKAFPPHTQKGFVETLGPIHSPYGMVAPWQARSQRFSSYPRGLSLPDHSPPDSRTLTYDLIP